MNTFLFVVVAAALVALAWALIAEKRKSSRSGFVERPRPRQPLDERQQAMYHRLARTLPDLVVLPQVSFGALLTARTKAARHAFGRKIADFVICDPGFRVVAIVGLDDKGSRKERARQEAQDALLADAGYRVLRYARVPDIGRLEADFDPSLAEPRLQIGPRFHDGAPMALPPFRSSTHRWQPSAEAAGHGSRSARRSGGARRRRERTVADAGVQASSAR